MHGNDRLKDETSKLFSIFLKKTGGTNPANFRGVCRKDIAARENIVQADFLNDFDIVDRSVIGELEKRKVGKHFKVVRPLRYISHICHVSNINALFKAYRFPSCNQFIKRAFDIEQHLTTCKEGVEHNF